LYHLYSVTAVCFDSTDILPLLVEQAHKNSTNKNVNYRNKMASSLFEAFRAFASASLAKEVCSEISLRESASTSQVKKRK
jgi:hypothetical protein